MAPSSPPTSFAELVNLLLEFVNILIPGVFGILFVFFVWKIIDTWILNVGDEQKRRDGKQYALWAVLMFVLMVSTWGIVIMLQSWLFPGTIP